LISPLISIITISLNAEKYLEQTIQSVLNQTYKKIEYIVVDGGSTDRTVEIINKYKNQIDYFISENDEGIADAMNKGVALAKGDYIVFIHADDYFKDDNSLEEALEFFEETSDIIACSIQFGKQLKIYKPRGFNFWTNFKQGIYHQGIFCRRSLIEELNGFDKQFKIAMDYDFFLRTYHRGARLVRAPVVFAVMRDTGISSQQDWKNLKKRFDEERKVHEKNCNSLSMRMLYKFYWFLYLPYKYTSYAIKSKGGRLK
jgi:glycosyltransferase involved in cell wall biosynthesis